MLNATFASSIPTGSVNRISEQFGISVEVANLVTTLFLLGYCFGLLFWAPLSEFCECYGYLCWSWVVGVLVVVLSRGSIADPDHYSVLISHTRGHSLTSYRWQTIHLLHFLTLYVPFNFLCAFTPNFAGLLIGRFLTGTFAAAPLSNIPGVLADI